MPNRKVDFTIKLILVDDGETEVGSVVVDTNRIIQSYKEDKVAFSIENAPLSQELRIEYELFIDKTRFNLDSAVKSFKGESEPSSNKKR